MIRTHGFGPGGLRRQSLMKIIKGGHAVARRGQGRVEVDREGGVVRRLGQVRPSKREGTLFPRHVKRPRPVASVLGSGWIVYGLWHNDSTSPVSLFRTTWTVPPPPQNPGDQTLLLFNGIQNADMILQPVLQWGDSALGGGKFWAAASWLAGHPGQVFHRSEQLVAVQPGQVLNAVITLTDGTPPGPYSYNCQFEGLDGTSLDVQDENELTDCVETLEAYGIQSGSDYPDGGGMTAMSDIQIQVGGAEAALSWQTEDASITCGEHAELVSNDSPGGEIDLHY
jgi:hypothetical protein